MLLLSWCRGTSCWLTTIVLLCSLRWVYSTDAEERTGLQGALAAVLLRSPQEWLPLPPLAALPKVFVLYDAPMQDHNEDRPATAMFLRWLEVNGLVTDDCDGASWVLMTSGCADESQVLDEWTGHITGEPGGRATLDCVLNQIEDKRLVSGVCVGDDGFGGMPEGPAADVIRISMNGLRVGREIPCESQTVCKGTVRAGHDVVVPGLQLKGRDEGIFAAMQPISPDTPREVFFFFGGSLGRERPTAGHDGVALRKRVMRKYRGHPGYDFQLKTHEEYLGSLLQAEFCLAPLGMHGGRARACTHACSLCPSLPRAPPRSPLHTHTHTHTHSLSLSPSLTHTHTHTPFHLPAHPLQLSARYAAADGGSLRAAGGAPSGRMRY